MSISNSDVCKQVMQMDDNALAAQLDARMSEFLQFLAISHSTITGQQYDFLRTQLRTMADWGFHEGWMASAKLNGRSTSHRQTSVEQ